MGTINREWHAQHPMPAKPTVEQRIAWHEAHARHCSCRPIPVGLKALIQQRRRQRGE